MSNEDKHGNHDERSTEKEYALIDIYCVIETDVDFSSVKRHNNCVTAIYEDGVTGVEHEVRMECCNADEYSKMFKAQIELKCSPIKPACRSGVSEYVLLANEFFNYLFDQSPLVSVDHGSRLLVQMNCSNHEDIADIVLTMTRIISAVSDDIISLANGRMPVGLLDGRVQERFDKVLSDDMGQLLYAEKFRQSDNSPIDIFRKTPPDGSHPHDSFMFDGVLIDSLFKGGQTEDNDSDEDGGDESIDEVWLEPIDGDTGEDDPTDQADLNP